MKCGQKCCVAILCAIITVPYAVFHISFGPEPNVVEDDVELVLLPEKSCYSPGEYAWGVFRVAGNQPLGGFGYPYYLWVLDDDANLVYHFEPYKNGTIELRPGETSFYGWRQEDNDGNQVPEGEYTVRVGWETGWIGNHTNLSTVLGVVKISIGDCPPLGLVVSAGEDITSKEGEQIVFNGSVSYRSPLSCQDKDFSRHVTINDESSRPTVGTSPKLMDIKVDSNGIVHVVWSDFRNGNHDVYYSKSTDGGKTFSKNVKVNDDTSARHQWKPSVAVDSKGIIHIVWEDIFVGLGGQPSSIFYSRSEDGGGSFIRDILVSEGTQPSMTVDSEGRVHVVFIYGDVLHAVSDKSGSAFSTPAKVNDVHDFVYGPSIAIDSFDNLHIAWEQSDGWHYNEILYAKSTDGGKSFSSSVKVNDGGPLDLGVHGPEVAVDSYGNPHVIWTDNRRKFIIVGEVYYANSSNGGTSFNPNIAVHERLPWWPEEEYQYSPSIALDEEDNVHVAWIQRALIIPYNNDVYYARKMRGDEAFSFVEEVRDNCAASQARHPDMTVGPDGLPYVIWYDRRDLMKLDVHFSKRNGSDEEELKPELFWDFDSQMDSDGDGNFTNDIDATGLNLRHIYGDNGNFIVTARARIESGVWVVDTMRVTVYNVLPDVTVDHTGVEGVPMGAYLRIAGEKWHDVSIELYEDGVLIENGSLTRYPGSPNDQMLNLTHLTVNISRKYSAIVRYTPEDDPVNGQPNGANPCWIILRFDDGEEVWLHHTFNVQHPETYIWEVDLARAILLHGFTFEATAYDPGSDDLTFYWDFGDGTNVTSFYPNDDKTFPVVITETITHAFPRSGTYVVTLTVQDDDGGVGVAAVSIVIP